MTWRVADAVSASSVPPGNRRAAQDPVRAAVLEQGKSGATRVCYVHFTRAEAVYLLAIFPKIQQTNLTAGQRAEFKKLIEAIEAAIERQKEE